MNIKIEEIEQQTWVWLEGRMDTITAPELEEAIKPVLEQKPDIVIDFSSLHYISSAGLRVFLIIQKQITANRGKLILRKMQPQIKQVFDMTGLSSIFTIEES